MAAPAHFQKAAAATKRGPNNASPQFLSSVPPPPPVGSETTGKSSSSDDGEVVDENNYLPKLELLRRQSSAKYSTASGSKYSSMTSNYSLPDPDEAIEPYFRGFEKHELIRTMRTFLTKIKKNVTIELFEQFTRFIPWLLTAACGISSYASYKLYGKYKKLIHEVLGRVLAFVKQKWVKRLAAGMATCSAVCLAAFAYALRRMFTWPHAKNPDVPYDKRCTLTFSGSCIHFASASRRT